MVAPDKVAERSEALGWQYMVSLLLSNPILWRLLTADFTTSFAVSATSALFVFFATYVFELQNQASLATVVQGVTLLPL